MYNDKGTHKTQNFSLGGPTVPTQRKILGLGFQLHLV